MSQQGNSAETESPETLPRGMVLGYMGDWGEPTGVRKSARKLLVKTAIGDAIIAFLAMSIVIADAFIYDSPLYLAFHYGAWSDVLETLTSNYAVPVVIAFLMLGSSLIQFVLAPRVARGHGFSCLACVPSLFPPGLVLLLISAFAVIGGVGILYNGERMELLLAPALFVVAGVSAMGTLVLVDLAGFLRWIARNPSEEKPPVPFLPPKGAGK